jgi:hypothetical protein
MVETAFGDRGTREALGMLSCVDGAGPHAHDLAVLHHDVDVHTGLLVARQL